MKATYCTPWVAAFVQWCIGVGPTIYMNNERLVIEQPTSNITLIAITGGEGPSLEISIYESLGSPTELISAGDYMQCGSRMVTIERYGPWLLEDCGLDSGLALRATSQALPYCLKHIAQSLRLSKLRWYEMSEDVLKTEQQPFIGLIKEKELLEKVPCPFPKDSIISAILSRMLRSTQTIGLVSLKDGLVIIELPLVDLYVRDLRKNCSCSNCKCSGESSDCKNDHKSGFLRTLSIIAADILALSLFDFPESLLVSLSGCRPQSRTLEEAVFSILKQDQNENVICLTTEILHHALSLIGHDVDHDISLKEWVISSFRGQVVYPKIFETQYLEIKGYLTLNWAPGLLQYNGEKYSRGVSESLPNLQEDSLDSLDSQVSLKVDIPRNLVSDQKTAWQIGLRDDFLLINMGIQNSTTGLRHISKSPFKALLNIGHSLLLETCPHPSEVAITEPNAMLQYTGPLEPFRPPGEEVRPSTPIGIVAVKGNNGLRMLSLACGSQTPFVIRRGACLSCCIELCLRTGFQMIVC